MDTKKIGAFLKQCRKENNLTQEQLAEKFGVSARTVSRWETGSNMPDLSILIELADYYDIEIKELLDGERSSTMNKEMKETLNKVADYEEWVKQSCFCIDVPDQCRNYYHTAPIDSKTSSGAGRNVNCSGGRNCICVSYGT